MLATCLRTFLALVFLVSAATAATAEDTPNLVGTWELAKAPVISQIDERRQISTSHEILVIEHQDGDLFYGRSAWWDTPEHESATDPTGAGLGYGGFESIIGIIGFDGLALRIVEVESEGLFTGRILDADSLELTFTEIGAEKSVLFKGVFKRKN